MDSNSPFSFQLSQAINHEAGITRRDPSPVVFINGKYHVYYTKSTRDRTGYYGTIWHAESNDGRDWLETGEALGLGPSGKWDDHAVFTPTTLIWNGSIYLFYTAVQAPFDNDNGGPLGNPTAIGVAMAKLPQYPFERVVEVPVIKPGPDIVDSYRVDDSCALVRDGRIWLYYKGRECGKSPETTKMCLALADRPEGPYRKFEANPVLPSGHEVCVWPHGPGVCAMVSRCGPAGHTLQYAEDGIHFRKVSDFVPPLAPGPFREDAYEDGKGQGVRWGLAEAPRTEKRPSLVRWDCDLGIESFKPWEMIES